MSGKPNPQVELGGTGRGKRNRRGSRVQLLQSWVDLPFISLLLERARGGRVRGGRGKEGESEG